MFNIELKGHYRVIQLNDGNLIGEAAGLIHNNKADGINLNYIENFPTDLNSLNACRNIKWLTIHDYPHNWKHDYSVIHNLNELEYLSLYTTDKVEIDYSKFPVLKSAALMWRPRAKSIFDCTTLERLFLGKFLDKDLTRLKKLKDLKYLRINTGSLICLEGIEALENLEEILFMQVTKLSSIKGLDKLKGLKQLTIDNCRNIKDIELTKTLNSGIKIRIGGTTPLKNGA